MSSRLFLTCTASLAIAGIGLVAARQSALSQPVLGTRSVKVLDVDGLKFKDLNKNGKLDTYEDWRKPVDARVDDLVSRMTLEEKAGLMVSPTLTMGRTARSTRKRARCRIHSAAPLSRGPCRAPRMRC